MRLCASSVSVAHSSFHYFVLHVRLGNREHGFGTVTQESRLKLFIQEDHVISKICYCQAKHPMNSCSYITVMIITVI